MNIKRESIGELNEMLTVHLSPSDYQEKVDKALREQSKKAKLPGFRPGTVPIGHVKKLYGKNILVDEVNHVLSSTLNHYLEENKIEILGNPIPSEGSKAPNWEDGEEFEFKFEIGIAPVLDVSKLPVQPIEAYTIIPDQKTLDSRTLNLRRAYGKMSNPEIAESGDVLFLEIEELDENQEPQELGIRKKVSLRTDQINNPEIQGDLIGLKKDDQGKINLLKAFNSDPHPLGHLLDIPEDEAAKHSHDFKFQVLNINRLSPSDLDSEFFLKIFPGGEVQTEEEFNEKIKEEIGERMRELSDKRLNSDLILSLIRHFTSVLPHQFLRKWLLTRNDPQYTEENIGQNYPEFERNLKWSLISNQISKQYDIKVEPQEIVEEAKNRLRIQFRMYSQEPIGEDELNEYSMKLLQNREQVNMLYEEVRTLKVLHYLKSHLNIEYKEIQYDEFLKLN